MVCFFADSSFLVALAFDSDNRHNDAKNIYDQLHERSLINEFQNFCVTDYVIAEVFQLLQKKIGFSETVQYYTQIVQQCQIKKVSYPETIEKAIKSKLQPFCNKKSGKPNIGLVDATSLVAMDESGIPYIISFDDHFLDLPLIHTINKTESINVIWNVQPKKSFREPNKITKKSKTVKHVKLPSKSNKKTTRKSKK
jgi:predicted nucleic acid-binding protein